MADSFLGEIRLFSFGFAPKGWASCNGQLLPINQNTALFSLLGTTYGGNGQTTFALPDLRGRAPMHLSQAHPQGEQPGTESVTLTASEMPAHRHIPQCNSTSADQLSPSGHFWGKDQVGNRPYATTADTTLAPQAIGNAGGSQPHDNMAPGLVLNFCIALQGIFPSRS
jgi:microcystin-dependent protein